MARYNVNHVDSAAIRAIAETLGGDVICDANPVTADGEGIAVIEFPDDQSEYAEELLDGEESVVSYR